MITEVVPKMIFVLIPPKLAINIMAVPKGKTPVLTLAKIW
jgi:hypothetical protein